MKNIILVKNLNDNDQVETLRKALSETRVDFDINLDKKCVIVEGNSDMVAIARKVVSDHIDDFATHICIYEDGKALGCVRFYVENDKMRIGRLAVLKQARKKHLGAYLLELAEREIRKSDYREVYLDAQCRVAGFYEKQGYVICGEQHLDEHVPHVLMKKVL